MRNTGPTPEFIWLSVSNVCNLSCPFCVHGWTDIDVAKVCGSDRKFIDVNRFRQMVDEISEYNTLLGLVGSGETMLHPEIYDMLAYASLEKNVRIQIHTNGHFMDPDRMARMGPIHVIFSIDGFTQETYEKYRRGGNLALALDNLTAFAKAADTIIPDRRPIIQFKYLVNRHTERDIEKARAFAESLPNVGFMLQSFLIPPPSWAWRVNHPGCATKDAYQEWAPRIEKDYDLYYFDKKKGVYRDKFYLLPIDGNCVHIKKTLFVAIDGNAYACCLAPAAKNKDTMYYGNIFQTGVKEVFSGERANRFRQSYYDSAGKLELCMSCSDNRLRKYGDAAKISSCQIDQE